jgi:NDP-sugar pyrophosphorylase family protein
MIKEYLKAKNNFGIKIILSDETHQLLDTGGGLKKAAPFLLGDEPVIIHNVDILTDLDLTKVVEFHLEKKALATIVGRYRETQRYFLTDSQGYLTGWENKKTGEQRIVGNKNFANTAPLAFSGIHVINPEFLRLIKQEGKFSIIDTYLDLAQNHKIIAFTDNSSFWMDIGKTDELEKANRMVAEGTVRI